MKTLSKHFTSADVRNQTIYADRTELIYAPLQWQLRGLQQTATGYGSKITTREKISFNGQAHRLYCTCYSNGGSVWFMAKGVKYFVN